MDLMLREREQLALLEEQLGTDGERSGGNATRYLRFQSGRIRALHGDVEVNGRRFSDYARHALRKSKDQTVTATWSVKSLDAGNVELQGRINDVPPQGQTGSPCFVRGIITEVSLIELYRCPYLAVEGRWPFFFLVIIGWCRSWPVDDIVYTFFSNYNKSNNWRPCDTHQLASLKKIETIFGHVQPACLYKALSG